jgi:hypothetical protein
MITEYIMSKRSVNIIRIRKITVEVLWIITFFRSVTLQKYEEFAYCFP